MASQVPFAEPPWLAGLPSPYFNESHRKLQRAVREFVDEHVKPEAQEKELDGTFVSQELVDKMAANNLMAMLQTNIGEQAELLLGKLDLYFRLLALTKHD